MLLEETYKSSDRIYFYVHLITSTFPDRFRIFRETINDVCLKAGGENVQSIGLLLYNAIYIYSFIIIGYILLSWFPNARESSFGQMLGRICEPFLEPFRRFIPPLGMIDFSPIVAIIALRFAGSGVRALFGL